MFDPACAEDRELLAREAYYRERSEEAAIDREHSEDGEAHYWCLSWEDLSDYARRPYRVSVGVVLDQLERGRVTVAG